MITLKDQIVYFETEENLIDYNEISNRRVKRFLKNIREQLNLIDHDQDQESAIVIFTGKLPYYKPFKHINYQILNCLDEELYEQIQNLLKKEIATLNSA